VATIPLFLLTRTLAAWNRESNIAAGRSWYEGASAPLREGQSVKAIEYLRKATVADRENLQYSLALAEALIANDQTLEARQILLRIRNSKPEDGRINLYLARLSVKDYEMEDARRYYHQALYGYWPDGKVIANQAAVRMELVKFLVMQHDISNAVSELLILAAGSPSDFETYTELGRLFLLVDEPARALIQFRGALMLQPMNSQALIGAGAAEFKLGNDEAARRQFQNAALQGPLPAEAQHDFDLAGLVLSGDPLTSGIGGRERVRRLGEVLRQGGDRMDRCMMQSAVPDPIEAESIKTQATLLQQQVLKEQAVVDLNLAARAESIITEACGPGTDADTAIVLAAERHKVNTP
jgi:tetratricopeptide (TPR) repeat protein